MPLRRDRQAPLSSEYDAHALISRRLWIAAGVAIVLHAALLIFTPAVAPPRPKEIITMEVVRRTPPPPPPAPEPPQPAQPEAKEERAKEPPRPRALPKELQPVERKTPEEPNSPAAVLPAQPQQPEGPQPKGPLRPLDLFPQSLSRVVGGGPPGGTVPKGQNRLLKDERLDEKKGPQYVLVPERGGGLKYEGEHFIAHIAPDGALSFENRSPIGFAKGQTGFNFDLTDIAMRGAKQDPYGAEKRRFVEYSGPIREEMRKKKTQSTLDSQIAALPRELGEIWESGKPLGVRRRELYEYWLACADDKEGDGTTGQRARRQVEDFIRRHLPAGSPEAYTEEELRRFAGQREGLPPFDPYHSLR